MAPDRGSPPEYRATDDPPNDVLYIALVIPLRQWVSFSKYIVGNVRLIKPKGYTGEVEIRVLPDLGEDFVDFDQYDAPTVDLTLLKAALKP